MLLRVTCIFLSLFITPLSYSNSLLNLQQKLALKVEYELKNHNIPGAAYTIVKNNKIIDIKTFGHLDTTKTKKVDKESVFRLASVSKTFAATIAIMLAQENQLNLSDPVTKYVPQFSLAIDGAAEKIQLKHILSHSSGLMPNAYDNLLHENWSMDKIIRRFSRVEPICEPAQCYGYQNIAYAFLQPAIESIQNKTYAALLQDRVFSPLGMKNASVGIEVFLEKENTAKPHVLRKKLSAGTINARGEEVKKYIWRKVKVTPDYYKVEASAGVNASITDIAKWLIANLGYKQNVLSTALLDELTTPRIRTKKDLRRKFWKDDLTDAHYGYGWRIYQFNDSPIIYHSGWVAGFRADIGYSPDLGIGFAMLINAESNIINEISNHFWSQAHEKSSLAVEKQLVE